MLAIDGDPSSNLHMALGMPLTDTVGDIREEMNKLARSGKFDVGLSKLDYIDLKIKESLVEAEKIDLLAMGRPEGPGCYCAANNMLRTTIDQLEKNYDYVVIDNEAGMEHISRQTTRDVDVLLVVSDPSMRGLVTAARMKHLIAELRTKVGRIALVVNRIDNGLTPEAKKLIEQNALDVIGLLPSEARLSALDARGAPVTDLPEDSPLRLGVFEIVKKLNLA